MVDTDDSIAKFFKAYNQLRISSAELFYEKAYDKNLVINNMILIREGRYVIEDSIWKIDKEGNHKYIAEFIKLLGSHIPEFGKNYTIINEALKNNPDYSKDLILLILTNQSKKISDFGREMGLSNDFLTFFSLFSGLAYREAVKDFVTDTQIFHNHISGFCPICGHWPGMSYIVGQEGKKILVCLCCNAQWSFNRLRCSFCLSSEKDSLAFLNVEGEDEISAYTCENCRRYIKTKKISKDHKLTGYIPIMDFMNSGFIDIAAMQNKYIQESLLGTRFNGPHDYNIKQFLES